MAEETDEQNMLRLSQDELAVIASLLAPEDLGAFSRSCKHCRGALAAQLKAAYGECRLIITTHAPFLLDACGRHNWPQRYEYFEIRPQTLGDRGVRMFAHIVRLVTESEHSFDPVIIDHACDGVNFTDQGCSADVALKMCEAAQASGVLKVLCSKHIHPRVHVPTDLFGRTVQLDRPSADQKYRWTDADAIFVAHSLPALERPVELQLGSSPSFAGGVPARHEIGDKGAFALAVGLQRTRGGVAYCNLLKCRFGVQSAWALVAATEPAADADGGGGGGKFWTRPPADGACGAPLLCGSPMRTNFYGEGLSDSDAVLIAASLRRTTAQWSLSQKDLNLAANRLSDAGGVALASALEARCVPALRKLYLAANHLSDAAGVALCGALRSLPELRDLRLDRNSLGDTTILALAAALRVDDGGDGRIVCPTLKQLDVARNPFSAKAEQELQGACAPRREGHLKARPQLKAKLRLSCRPMPPKERLGEHAVGEDVLGLALRKLRLIDGDETSRRIRSL